MKTQLKLNWLVLMTLIWASLLPLARAYYDPAPQRWVNRDPLGEVGFESLKGRKKRTLGDGLNPYSFVHNNPPNRFDSDGRKGKGPLAFLISLITGCQAKKAPGFPQLSANCAKDQEVKNSYKRLWDCKSQEADGSGECAEVCDCLAQDGDVGKNLCYNNCMNAYRKRCL